MVFSVYADRGVQLRWQGQENDHQLGHQETSVHFLLQSQIVRFGPVVRNHRQIRPVLDYSIQSSLREEEC